MNIGSVKMNTCLIMTRECITFLYSPLCSVDYPRVSWQVTGWLRWQHRKHQHPIFHNRDGDGCEHTQNIVHWVCTRCIAALHSEPCRRKVLSTQCAVRGGAFRVVCLGLCLTIRWDTWWECLCSLIHVNWLCHSRHTAMCSAVRLIASCSIRGLSQSKQRLAWIQIAAGQGGHFKSCQPNLLKCQPCPAFYDLNLTNLILAYCHLTVQLS